jgi:hypothetical protein
MDDSTTTPEQSPPHDAASVALRSRVVREAHRHTWFVVNEGATPLATIPLERTSDSNLRRVEVNGEVAEFTTAPGLVLVEPRRELRAGAGTIVVLHFR